MSRGVDREEESVDCSERCEGEWKRSESEGAKEEKEHSEGIRVRDAADSWGDCHCPTSYSA